MEIAKENKSCFVSFPVQLLQKWTFFKFPGNCTFQNRVSQVIGNGCFPRKSISLPVLCGLYKPQDVHVCNRHIPLVRHFQLTSKLTTFWHWPCDPRWPCRKQAVSKLCFVFYSKLNLKISEYSCLQEQNIHGGFSPGVKLFSGCSQRCGRKSLALETCRHCHNRLIESKKISCSLNTG